MQPALLGILASSISGSKAVTNSYSSIATVTLSSNTSSVTFSSIPTDGTYKHLELRVLARSNRSASADYIKMQFNSDTSSVYYDHVLVGDGSAASASTSQAYYGTSTVAQVRIPVVAASTTTNASTFGASVTSILDYTDTNKYKVVRALGGYDDNGSGNINLFSGLWRSTSAISSITLTPNNGGSGSTTFPAYSHFALYGIKA